MQVFTSVYSIIKLTALKKEEEKKSQWLLNKLQTTGLIPGGSTEATAL